MLRTGCLNSNMLFVVHVEYSSPYLCLNSNRQEIHISWTMFEFNQENIHSAPSYISKYNNVKNMIEFKQAVKYIDLSLIFKSSLLVFRGLNMVC